MKVPDELVKVALKAGRWSGEEYTLGDETRVRDALQAVLPKVRERLCTQGNLANQAAAGTVEATCFPKDHGLGPVAFEGAARMIAEAAFDHAFPGEDS